MQKYHDEPKQYKGYLKSALMGSVVGRREREFGIRAALGATPATVARLVFRHAGRLALAGVAVGLGVSLAAAQGLADLLYGVDARDPLTFAVVTLALGAAVMTACVAPPGSILSTCSGRSDRAAASGLLPTGSATLSPAADAGRAVRALFTASAPGTAAARYRSRG